MKPVDIIGQNMIDALEKEGYRIVKLADIDMLENLLYHLQRSSSYPVTLNTMRDLAFQLKQITKHATPKKEST